MSRMLPALSLSLTLLTGTAAADTPRVAVDIAPIHSLVARVMADVGTPDLILPPGASPHEYSLRPSEAAALQNADIVVWMGKDLAPWMEHAVDSLASTADVLTLLEAPETQTLEFREGALFEAHKDHDHAHSHDHKDDDAHAWLAPSNAATWLDLIAAKLSAADPANATTYAANAAAGRAELDALNAEVNALLAPVRGRSFIVFHDAYQYFEEDFDFPAAGAISLSDATDPSPSRIAQVQSRVREQSITCVLAEPQFNSGILSTVLEGTAAKTALSDPLGVGLEPGPTLYPQLIRNLATALAACL